MKYEIREKNAGKYIMISPESGVIGQERDGLTLVSLCVEHGIHCLLIPGECLSADFLRLSTRVAGLVLQKLANYGVRAAVVMDTGRLRGKFREFVNESNRGSLFRVYSDLEQAENWLTQEDRRG